MYRRPVMLFLVYFLLVHKKLEIIKQENSDLYHNMCLAAWDKNKELPFSGRNL